MPTHSLDVSEAFKNICVLQVDVKILDEEFFIFCDHLLDLCQSLDTVEIAISSLANNALYDRLLDFLFNSKRWSIKDLSIDIPILDAHNTLLQRVEDCYTLTKIRFDLRGINGAEGFRFGSPTKTFVLANIDTLTITGKDGPVLDVTILNSIDIPCLRTLVLYRIELNEEVHKFVVRHSNKLEELSIRANMQAWDLLGVVSECKNLNDLSLDCSYILPYSFKHQNIRIVTLDNLCPGINMHNVDWISRRALQELNRFIQTQPELLFPQLQTIYLIDFHNVMLRWPMTTATKRRWRQLLRDCRARNIVVFDCETKPLKETEDIA